MSGSVKSIPYSGRPVTIASMSTFPTSVPMIRNWSGVLSGTVSGSGAVIPVAAFASSPYVALRPLERWWTTPSSVVSSERATPHSSAAACSRT
jgi:hypothetical protein